MQDLKVIGVENGALLAASDDGVRYRIAIDEVMQSRLRQQKKSDTQPSGPRLSPREIQAHIRAGMSAADVATLTSAPLEYIQRFEGPVLAEREHIVASALSVPVHTTVDIDPLGEAATFGTVIRDRLASLQASGERWASWKDPEEGWIVKLAFTADEIDHDARWGYDMRKHSLTPLNSEATTLSQQGELHGGLIPRLRAVGSRSGEPDDSRFDSGAFTFSDGSPESGFDSAAILEQVSLGRNPVGANNSFAISAITRSREDDQQNVHQTADLLEALRRRRGERESAGYREADEGVLDRPDAPRLVDVPLGTFDADGLGSTGEATGQQGHGEQGHGEHGASRRPAGAGRKGRASMPSWDEIVFGARTDED